MTTVPFNTARGAASSLQMAPPFAFSDVTMSVFPLRASLSRLDTFCRNYLNQAPHLVQFRPFIPFVYLVILDYGRMSLQAANMGWVSQREVAFGIPLRWLNATQDGLEFHDWAFTSPFIFVDNEMSMSTGREVYGWPKLLAKLDPSVSEWVRDPHGARRVFQVSTKRAAHAYAGEMQDYRPFLSVHQHRAAGLFDMPPNLDTITKPLAQLSGSAAGFTRLSVDLLRTFTGMASDQITGSSVLPDFLDLETFKAQLTPEKMKSWVDPREWVPGVRDMLWSLFPRSYANTINFKQFRDAGDPHATCYQAITSARMPVKSVRQGGLLGPQNMLLGQLDGGFRIDIHSLAGLPIIESLGLEVAEEREADGTLVSSLAPVCPLWLQVDMTYGLADTLVWRGREGDWRKGEGMPSPVGRQQSSAVPKEKKAVKKKDTNVAAETFEDKGDEAEDAFDLDYIRTMNFFNTARGASEAIGGAFTMPHASIRVLPLKADAKALQKFVSEYLHVEKRMRFDAWGDFVYLIVCDFEQMNSTLNAVAKRRAREVNLVVPVKCYSWFDDEEFEENEAGDSRAAADKAAKHMVTTGFVSAFSYVDDTGSAITASEVSGVPTMGARILSPENDWLRLDLSQDRAKRDILDMKAQVLPALMSGAQAQERSIIQLHSHTPPQTRVRETQHELVNKWVNLLADDLQRKGEEASSGSKKLNPLALGQGFVLQLLGGDLPVNQFSLKQFRDSKHTQDACYQGLIQRRHWIQKLIDMRELEEPLHVSITDFPTQPITEILGLVPKFSYPGKDRTVKVFEALRPFSLTADLVRESGDTLFERFGSDVWRSVENIEQTSVEQIFGWRMWDRREAEEFVSNADSFDEEHPIELSYVWNSPARPRPFHHFPRKTSSEFLKKNFCEHIREGEILNLAIRERNVVGGVRMVTDQALLDSVTAGDVIDIAAFNAQAVQHGRDTKYSQSDAARALASISPATVADTVLSRQWGLASRSLHGRPEKPDFCISVETVPSDHMGALFPKPECCDCYWPFTETRSYDEIRRRNREVLGIKAELRTVIEVLSLIFSKALDSSRALDGFRDAMRQALTDKERALFDKAVAGIRKSGPDTQLMLLNFLRVFIDIMLPEPFKLEIKKAKRGKLHDEIFARHRMVRSKDWSALEHGLKRFFDCLKETTVGDSSLHDTIEEANRIMGPRISENRAEMEIVEAAHSGKGDLEDFYLQDPGSILRQRLSKLVAGEIMGSRK